MLKSLDFYGRYNPISQDKEKLEQHTSGTFIHPSGIRARSAETEDRVIITEEKQ